jgi:hypothetical protein
VLPTWFIIIEDCGTWLHMGGTEMNMLAISSFRVKYLCRALGGHMQEVFLVNTLSSAWDTWPGGMPCIMYPSLPECQEKTSGLPKQAVYAEWVSSRPEKARDVRLRF